MRPLSTINAPVKEAEKGADAEVFGPQLALPLTAWAELSRSVPGPWSLEDQVPVPAWTAAA